MNGKVRALVGATGVSAVVAAVALSGGTSAFYYDSAHFTGNSISACGLGVAVKAHTTQDADKGLGNNSLAVINGGSDADVQATADKGHAIDITNVQPGDYFRTDFTVQNTGTCVGDLWADISGEDANNSPAGAWNSGTNPLYDHMLVSLYDATDPSNPTPLTCTKPGQQPLQAINAPYTLVAHELPCMIDKALDTQANGKQFVLRAVYGLDKGVRGQYQDISNPTKTSGPTGSSISFNVDFGLVQVGQNPDSPAGTGL